MAVDTLSTFKKNLVVSILRNCNCVFTFDTNQAGVKVPDFLSAKNKEFMVTFEVGRDMSIPIPNLRIDTEGIFGTLSFEKMSFDCFIPWDAIASIRARNSLHLTDIDFSKEKLLHTPKKKHVDAQPKKSARHFSRKSRELPPYLRVIK